MSYLVSRDGQELGPYTWPELQEMLAQGTLAPTQQVRDAAGGEWLPLATLASRMGGTAPAPAAPTAPSFATIPAYAAPGTNPGLGTTAFDPAAMPSYRLFDFRAVTIATLFGSPLAGGILMALNYRRLGQHRSAVAAAAYGFFGTVVATGLGFFLPQGIGSGVAVGLLVATTNYAKATQGLAIEEHLRRGGKLESRWLAFFIGLGILLLILGVAAVAVFAILVAKPTAFASPTAPAP